jgi:hypothetical protein
MICSGGMCHANTAIHKDNKRRSFIQYCMGGLSCHIEYGYCAGNIVPDRVVRAVVACSEERWAESLELFSTPASLDSDCIEFQNHNHI